ncbi:MAG: phosphoenolpyruvate--protein phosphotransferase [Verrucomicrobiota bacterium]
MPVGGIFTGTIMQTIEHLDQEIQIKGVAVSPGVAIGALAVMSRQEIRVPCKEIKSSAISSEIARLEGALMQTREQIRQIKERISVSIGEKDASIFDAHLLVLEDVSLLEAVKRQLEMKQCCVEYVYHHLMTTYARSMREIGDPYLQERATDIIDVGRRVLNNLMGNDVVDIYKLDRPSIILAHDLTPSDTALLDRSLVRGFATDMGSPTSHTAIMARSLQIPAVVGLRDASLRLESIDEVLLDGYEGFLILNPSEETKQKYGQIEERRHEVAKRLEILRETQGLTTDHHRVIISANVELPEDVPLLKEAGAEGIGLYRTEFLFLNRLQFPSEETQMEAYRKVIEAVQPHPTIIRTLDLGGDKLPSSDAKMEDDKNPFLGWRAIRYCLQEIDVFKTQLRAICRAGHGFKTRIMFPMIATLDELLRAKEILGDVRHELKKKRIACAEDIEVGTMIEVPSAAVIADKLAEHIDFFSIGTNDLIGYTLAVDRTNEKVAYLYQPTHPAILRLIRGVVKAAHDKGKWVGVCGETAGDVHLTPLLVGLGVDELSMGSVFLPRVKKAVQSVSYEEMKTLVEKLCDLSTAEEVAKQVDEVAARYYPELL